MPRFTTSAARVGRANWKDPPPDKERRAKVDVEKDVAKAGGWAAYREGVFAAKESLRTRVRELKGLLRANGLTVPPREIDVSEAWTETPKHTILEPEAPVVVPTPPSAAPKFRGFGSRGVQQRSGGDGKPIDEDTVFEHTYKFPSIQQRGFEK